FAARRPHSRIVRSPRDALPGSLIEDFLICTGQVLWTIPQVWIGGRRTWNVTAQERARELPADGMVKDALKLDRAITIARPPAEVWPWVARFGRGAGYYSWDFLDNRGHRHADYLVDAPEPAVGDANKLLGTIRHVDAGRELVWYEEADDFQKILGARVPNAFAFRIDPSEGGGTRVHLRLSIGIPRTLLARAIGRLVTLLDHVMATEMLRRLKFLVETHEERSRLGETNRALAPHQKPGEFRPVTAAP
ncbi:MAG: hypothetical protein HY720_26825, partial [Planctomycetes bacterium]|nr:hypothetical protein [Planctomycetota bacterium]